MYTPNNLKMYCAAYAGALAGMEVFGRNPVNGDPAAYAGISAVAGAFAQAFDTVWASTPDDMYTVLAVQTATAGYWEGRRPVINSTNVIASTFYTDARAVMAIVKAGTSYNTAQGITPPPFGGGSGAGSFAIFRPGIATAAPYYETWAEIVPLITAAEGAFDLYVDSSNAAAIVTSDLDGLSRLNVLPARGPVAGSPMRLTIQDGNQLSNLASMNGQIELFAEPTGAVAPYTQSNFNLALFLSNGAAMILGAGATRAFVDVAAGAANIVGFRLDFSSQFKSLAAGVPVINLLAAGAVFSSFYTGINPFTQPTNGAVAGPVGSTVLIVYDSSVELPDYGAFNGTLLTFQIDHGSIVKTEIDYTLARFQASGGVIIATLYPWYSVARPTAVLVNQDIELVDPLFAPLATASDAQIIDGFTTAPLSGVCPTLLGIGVQGFTCPPSPFLQVAADSSAHIPNFFMSITGDTFANLTQGHVKSTLLVSQQPRLS